MPLQATFTMTPNIVEVSMKRQWHIRRQFQATEDGARRGQAYQLLLQWRMLNESPPALVSPLSAQRSLGGADENRRLCPRLDAASKSGPDH
jgi:hypothetical protein